jgi:UDP-GlcNAc:undecaprenyl-phosphate/decaprenyl-phosphate GlcNAc-1-phosphate transferase
MLELLDNDIIRAVLVFLSSLAISYISIPSIIHVAKAKHLFDEPNGRTSHLVKTPTLGGISIFASLVISLGLFTDPQAYFGIQFLFAALTIVFFIGLKDDILTLAPSKKLIAQLIAAGIITVMADIRLSNFHGFLGLHEINYYVSILITVVVMVGVINGFNLIDGIDGLASGIGIVTALSFGIWFAIMNVWEPFIMSLGLVGSLIAFFRFNVFSKKHKLFMGDTGSLILGLTISVLMIEFNEYNIPELPGAAVSSAPAVSIGILILPLFDTLRVMLMRIFKGRSPFRPDKTHLHHYLLEFGLSHLKATSFIILTNLIFIALAFSLQDIGIGYLTIILLALCIVSTFVLSSFVKKKNGQIRSIKVTPSSGKVSAN